MFQTLQIPLFFPARLFSLVMDERADEYGEKAVIIAMVVLGGIVAWAAFGNRIVQLINQATAGM